MLQGWQGTRLPAFPIPECPHTALIVMEFLSTSCLLIKLLCRGPDVATTFREESIIRSVLGLLMTFPTDLTAVSVETTSVVPEEGQEMVE